MANLQDFKGKNIAVFGLGKAGKGAVAALHSAGAVIYAWDDDEQSRSYISDKSGINIALPKTYPWDKIEFLVLSPGIPFLHNPHPVVNLAQKAGCKIICDIELLYLSSSDSTYVGITGTNGKSTTTSLVQHIAEHANLNSAMGGNIGVAASSLPSLGKNGVYVLETSSYQLDLLDKTKFNIAVLMNITPDHIDRHGDMDGYIKAKKNIFRNQGKGDVAVIAIDDEYTSKLFDELSDTDTKTIPVSGYKSAKNGVWIKDGILFDEIDGKTQKIKLGKLKTLPGKHNQQNISAAYAAARMLGIEGNIIAEAIKTFAGLDHRLQHVAEINGITFINDSKATNANATSHALASFNNIYWIAGGLEKEGGILSLEKYFPKITHAFFIGKAQENFAKTANGKFNYSECGNLENALKKAFSMAGTDNNKPVILLSPACASFDQFADFEQRGDVFCNLVNRLKTEIK